MMAAMRLGWDSGAAGNDATRGRDRVARAVRARRQAPHDKVRQAENATAKQVRPAPPHPAPAVCLLNLAPTPAPTPAPAPAPPPLLAPFQDNMVLALALSAELNGQADHVQLRWVQLTSRPASPISARPIPKMHPSTTPSGYSAPRVARRTRIPSP